VYSTSDLQITIKKRPTSLAFGQQQQVGPKAKDIARNVSIRFQEV